MEATSPDVGVLLSGGVDSAVVLALLTREKRHVGAVWVDYGQPAAKSERVASRAIAKHYGAQWTELSVSTVRIPAKGEIPGRNDALVSLATMIFPGCSIAIGVHAGTGYADCSSEWVSAWQAIRDLEYGGASPIVAPLSELEKQDVFDLALELGVPLGSTYSCESASSPCGECSSCRDRATLDARP